ncbi:phage baseplate upper protein [Bacillus paralicheniformis]|uniref:phage baseplate upper protein n=1 Tax=Bacillus paralicheniformis TaxID=1648923 RepID=UPI002DBBEDCA|nr:phage baseplate upper protein [Bacillus paralicheniformis]MEC1866726.1 phage baseplate upper protein [Bacillus paralicheniformis]
MIYKNTAVHFDVNAQVKRSVSANIQFSTQDIGTAKLSFNLTKDGVPLPISKATHAKLFMKFTDGSQVYVNTEVEDALKGAIFYVLTPEQIKHAGTVHAELYVKYDNGQKMSVHKFSFEIDKALIDADIVPVAEYYFEDFETFKAEAEEMIDDLQAKFEMLDNIETKEGAQARADTAETNAKAYMDMHASKKDNPHGVTKDQIGLSKVDNVKQATKAEFDTHSSDNNRHITTAERTKWNGGQLFKITGDDGQPLVYVNATDDLHEILLRYKGFVHFYSHPNAINSPGIALRGFWNCNLAGTHGQIIAFDNSNRTIRKSITDGVWSDWATVITSADAAVTWQSPTLLNGWKQYGTHKVQFSKNALGEVELIGSITGGTVGFDVPAFTLPIGYRPLQTTHFLGVASSIGTGSTPQYHRTQIATDGTVYIQSCSNTVNPNEFITFGFKFKSA